MIYKEANTLVCNNFNDDYFLLHQHLMLNGTVVNSRNGTTRELLNFKTVINKPWNRCVAGWGRNINIFFLLAEAIWIFTGRRDLEFLEIFNSRMREYSDDGRYFNAPYGWRLRNWGVSSFQESMFNLEALRQVDQLAIALRMLEANPDDRRVVCSLWNPEFDLGVDSKDIACNDLLLFKIRNTGPGGEPQLHLTIQNRSNDLNWGLTTNVFQFSFLAELMARILKVHPGTQTHNSQSLHLYTENELTKYLHDRIFNVDDWKAQHDYSQNFYEEWTSTVFDFNFNKVEAKNATDRLKWIDFYLRGMIIQLLNQHKRTTEDYIFLTDLQEVSPHGFWVIYAMLETYIDYTIEAKNFPRQNARKNAVLKLLKLMLPENSFIRDYDILALGINFFLQRATKKTELDELKIIVNKALSKEVYVINGSY